VVRARRDPLDISQSDFVRRNLCFYCHGFDNKHCHKTVRPCTPQHNIHFVTERLCTPMLCRYIAPEPAGEGVVSDLVHCSHCNYMSMNDNELYIAHAVRSLTECIKYIWNYADTPPPPPIEYSIASAQWIIYSYVCLHVKIVNWSMLPRPVRLR
jgi:hypothetical protein